MCVLALNVSPVDWHIAPFHFARLNRRERPQPNKVSAAGSTGYIAAHFELKPPYSLIRSHPGKVYIYTSTSLPPSPGRYTTAKRSLSGRQQRLLLPVLPPNRHALSFAVMAGKGINIENISTSISKLYLSKFPSTIPPDLPSSLPLFLNPFPPYQTSPPPHPVSHPPCFIIPFPITIREQSRKKEKGEGELEVQIATRNAQQASQCVFPLRAWRSFASASGTTSAGTSTTTTARRLARATLSTASPQTSRGTRVRRV